MATHQLAFPLPAGLPVVLDTNVVLSLWMFEDPTLVRLRTAVEQGELRAFTRDDCLGELARVLTYPHFAQPPERQTAIFDAYRTRCIMITPPEVPTEELPRCADRDDQKFLELALDCGARALLTRDKLVLKLGKRPIIAAHFAILTPEQLQALLSLGNFEQDKSHVNT